MSGDGHPALWVPSYSAWQVNTHPDKYPGIFNGKNFATSAALADVCALLSVILVTELISLWLN